MDVALYYYLLPRRRYGLFYTKTSSPREVGEHFEVSKKLEYFHSDFSIFLRIIFDDHGDLANPNCPQPFFIQNIRISIVCNTNVIGIQFTWFWRTISPTSVEC